MKNRPEYEPLRASWARFKNRGVLSEEWEKFETFFKDALDAGWEVGDMVVRVDSTAPIGPDNLFIRKCDRKKQEEAKAAAEAELAATKGGYKNSPCISCPCDKDGTCDSYKKCKHYRLWISACWRDFKKAAEKLEE